MKIRVFCLCLFVYALSLCAAGETVTPALNWTCTKYASIENNILTVDVPADAPAGTYCARSSIDLAPFEGRCFVARIGIRGENVEEAPLAYLGLKFMLQYTITGTSYYPAAAPESGTFAEHEFTISDYEYTIGVRSQKGTLTLGLQGVSGKLVFDLNSISFEATDGFYPITNEDYVVSYPLSVTEAPRRRGVMLPYDGCTEEDFKTLASWGATLARYQMNSAPAFSSFQDESAYRESYDGWLAGQLSHLERDVLPWAEKYGLKIVIDLHSAPGGSVDGVGFRMFNDEFYKERFLAIWREIATRFNSNPNVYGYDLINEPYQRCAVTYNYWEIQRLAAEAVRAIDPVTPIIFEGNLTTSARGFSYLSPLAMDNVIYQLHFYNPKEYCMQGTGGATDVYTYPDESRGWNKAYLEQCLLPVLEFERKHHAKIYVGEFSATTWASGCDQFLADCTSIFNAHGWDWTYHAFREWDGWSVEHVATEPNKCTPSLDNPRLRALVSGIRDTDDSPTNAWTSVLDTFEEFRPGTHAVQMHRGWSGDGVVTNVSYSPVAPIGYPIPSATHTNVLDTAFGESVRDLTATNGAVGLVEAMVCVQRSEGALETPPASMRFAVRVDAEGRFCAWCAAEGTSAAEAGWQVLPVGSFANGDWVRLRVERRAVDGVACARVKANGRSSGWLRLVGADDADFARVRFVDTKVDDFLQTTGGRGVFLKYQ